MARMASHRKRFSSLFSLVLLSCSIEWISGARSSRENECAAYCSENQAQYLFKYEVGKSYLYQYRTRVKTLITGNTEEYAGTEVDTTVIVSVLTGCEFTLQLQNSSLLIDGSKVHPYSHQLDSRPLRFWFNQGRIERLCPGFDADPEFILNVKRGILSAFQTASVTPESLHYETDISGLCRTRSNTSSYDPETGIRISKVKNLAHCSGRAASGLPMRGSMFDIKSALKSEQSCVQDYSPDSLILSKSECEETHVVKPFSQGLQGASVLVKQSLTHVETKSTNELSLAFDNFPLSGAYTTLVYTTGTGSLLDSTTEDDTLARSLRQDFTLLAKSLRAGVSGSSPELYFEFLTRLRTVSANVMSKLLLLVEGLERKLLLSLIAQSGTDESLGLLVTQYDSRSVSDAEIVGLLSEIQAYQIATAFSVEKLYELSEKDSIRVEALLPLGSLIYRYCKTVDCQTDETVRTVIRNLDHSLPAFCRTYTNKDTLVTSAILKAIGNSGIYTSNLKACMFEPIGHIEVRLNAIRALRHVSCPDRSVSNTYDLFLNVEEHVEIRLQSYLICIECANSTLLNRVLHQLHDEPVRQVKSFILSHLMNLQQSTSTSSNSVRLRQILRNKPLSSFYANGETPNPLKYSTHFGYSFNIPTFQADSTTEKTGFFDATNQDGESPSNQINMESNLIYSNSYLPSSLYMNLSLNLFEEEVQLFEFGTRIQGLESRIESLFGKNGYFPDESVMKLLKSFHADHAESILDPRLNQVRSDSLARLRQDKLDLDEDNDLERDAFEPDTAREYLSYFVRTGGQDVKFGHYEKGLNELVAKFGRGFFEGGLFGAARDKENNLTNIHSHQVYLNNTASISSISGLPLVFHLDLINTFNFNYNYEFDASDLFRGQNLNFGLHFNPSVHLQFKSFLGVDLEFAEKLTKVEEELEDNDGVETEFDDRIDEVIRRIKNGLELKAKVATESFVDVKLSLNKGSLVDFKINVPRKHLELLDVSTRLLLHRGLETSSSQPYHTTGQTQSGANLISKTIPYPSLAQAYEAYDACWPDTLSDVVGLEFCSKLSAFNYSRLDAFNFSRTSPEQIVTAQFPLTGDFSWRIYLNKIDSFSRYELTASNNFNIINSRALKSFVLTFNTPGSLVDRKIHASLSIDPVNPALKLRLQCPLGNMELTGRYSAKDNHKGLTLLAHLNRQEIVNLDANLIVKNGVNTRYEPSLVIFYKNALFIDIRGHVDYIVGVKYNADLAVKGLTQRPIDISGDLAFSSNRTVVTLHMNSDQFGYFKIHGTLKNSPQGSFLAKGHVNYDIGKSAQAHQGHFLLKFDQYEKASLYKSNTHFKLESTQYENINLDLRHVFQSADHLFDSRLDFNIFGNPWSSRALYRNLHQRDSRGEMRESEREEGGEEIGSGAKGLKRSFELIGSLRSDKKQLHYKGQILHESTSSNTTSLVLAQLNDSTQLLGSYYLGANKQGGQTLELRAVSPWSGAKLRAEYLPYDANTMDATVQLEWHSVNINQYQLHGHLNYVYDPSTSLSKVSANFVLGNALDVNSASLVTDSLQYQLDAQWTSNSIQFNVYLPNNRHISGDLLYIASDTRGADYRTELTVSLKLNAHDAVQFDLLYLRDGRTHQELIATKLGWRHKFTNGNKMATSSNDWKEVEFNVGYKLFEKLNLELVLPEYYFHVNVDAKYLGLYNANSLNSELSWGSSRQTVSLIKSEAHFQLNFPHSYLNVTVLTPFSSWETLTLDSTFRLNNRSQDVKMELQATGRLPSHEINLFSHFTYNPHTNRFSTSLQTNNTLFSIESINFKIDHSNNGTVVSFSCDPGLDNNSLVSFQYEIIESIHSGHIEFFTPFKSVKFLSADLSFHRRLTEFSAKFTPFDILRGRLTAKGDYLFNYALGNGKENASENQNSPSGKTEQRFELNLQTPLKELKRLNIIFTNTQSTEYRLKFTLNDDISFANVNVTNSNQLPLAINAHVDIAKIVHDLRLKFILRSNEIAILVSENGEDLFDLKYEGTNNYIIQLKFAGNSIYGEAELNDNSMNFVGKWNNYTLNAESDYSITYKDLWFDCLIKAKIKSNSFKNDYDLLISHDSDSNNINNNVFNTDIKINQLTIIHKLIIQMDSLLHNKWINSISVNDNYILNEYHQIIVNSNKTEYSYLMNVALNKTVSTFNLSYSTDTALLLALNNVNFHFSIPEMDPFRLKYNIDGAFNTKVEMFVTNSKYFIVHLTNKDPLHFDLTLDSNYFEKINALVDLETPDRVLASFSKNNNSYTCSLHYEVNSYSKISLKLDLYKNESRNLSFQLNYDFSNKNYLLDLILKYNFSSIHSNYISLHYKSIYLTRYELEARSEFELLQDISVVLEMDLQKASDKNAKLHLVIDKEKYLHLVTSLSKLTKKIRLNAGLDSNLINREQNNYTLDVSVENINSHDYLIELKYKFNEKLIALNSKLIYNNNSILIEFVLTTPIDNYELVFLKFNIKWNSMNNYNLIFRLQKNTVVTHLNSSVMINNEKSNYNGFIYLSSPHEIFNNVHTDFNISFHNGLNFNVKVENINKTIQFLCANNINSTVLNIYTPYPGFENITLSSRITNENSNLFIFKNNAQWVKLSFEKTNAKNILFIMELPNYVFINKIDLKINLDKNIMVNISILKFDKHVETFSMEFTGGEFKCTIDLPSLNINNFNAHVKFTLNSSRTNVKIYVKIVNEVTPILFLKINYDEKRNFYLNLYKPMTNTSYVNIVGNYRNVENGANISKTVKNLDSKSPKDYVIAFDLTEIDKRIKFNVVMTNNTLRVHSRTNLLYVLTHRYDDSGVSLKINKEALAIPFVTFNLNFDPYTVYNVELNVNNTDNYFKYVHFNVKYNNETSKGHFVFEYLNKVKCYIELGKSSNGLVNMDTKLIINVDSLINVKTKITLNKTEIIPHVINFDYNYMANENYVDFNLNYEKLKLAQSELILNYKVHNKVYSFRLGNNSLIIQSDILDLDIVLTKTHSTVYFDFESFCLNFEHNIESPEKYVQFNLTTTNVRNLFFVVKLSIENQISIELEHMKYRTFCKFGSLFVEEFYLSNANSNYSLNFTAGDKYSFHYNIIESRDAKDLLMRILDTSIFTNTLDEFLIELYPSLSLENKNNDDTSNKIYAKNGISVSLQNTLIKLKFNHSSSIQYSGVDLIFNTEMLNGDIQIPNIDDLKKELPKINLNGTMFGYSMFIVNDLNIVNINITNIETKEITFHVQRTPHDLTFVHTIAKENVYLNVKQKSVKFNVKNTVRTAVNIEIDFVNTNRFLNASLVVENYDLDINVMNKYNVKENDIDWQIQFTSNNFVYLHVDYSGNFTSKNILTVSVPTFSMKLNHIWTSLMISVECNNNNFTLDWKNEDSTILEKLLLLLKVGQDTLEINIINTDEKLTVQSTVVIDSVKSGIKLTSAKSKYINLDIIGTNILFLKDVQSFRVKLECSCDDKVRVVTHFNFETKDRSLKNSTFELRSDVTSFQFDIKSNILKNVSINFNFYKDVVNAQVKINEKFVKLMGKTFGNNKISINLTSSEFKTLNLMGNYENWSGLKIELNTNETINSVMIKYNYLSKNNTVINLIGYLNNEQVLNFDFTYDLRQQMKNKLVYLNVKYKSKQVILIENKFNSRDYFFNYKLSSNILQNKLHLDYKFQVQMNLNELKNGNKMKIFIEFPEIVHVNKTFSIKFNPQNKQYLLQLTDLIDIVSNASGTTVKLNCLSINWESFSKYTNKQIILDFRRVQSETSKILEYYLSSFSFELNHEISESGLDVDLKLNGYYGDRKFDLLADLKLSPSNFKLDSEFNGKSFNLSLINSQRHIDFVLSSDLLTVHFNSFSNKSQINTTYSLSFLDQIHHHFKIILNETTLLYHFNDFLVNILFDRPKNVFELVHSYHQNYVRIHIDSARKSLSIKYFGKKAEFSLGGNLNLDFFDDDKLSGCFVSFTRNSQYEQDVFMLSTTLMHLGKNYSISCTLKKSDKHTNLEFNFVNLYTVKLALFKNKYVEADFKFILQDSFDNFIFHASLKSDETTLQLSSNLTSKNISTNFLRVQFNKDIRQFDLNFYDSLLLNYDYVHNYTFNIIVFSNDVNSSFNIDFIRNNIYLNVNLLSFSYEFEYEIQANKILLKYKRFYQSTLMQNIHVDYHYVRDFYKLKIVIYSLIGLNLELDSNISFNNKNVNGALHYSFNKIENSLVFKITKLDIAKNVEIICKLPILRLKNYRINFSIDPETLTIAANEINNKKIGDYFHFEILNSMSEKRLAIKTPVQLNKNIFVTLNVNINLHEKSLNFNSSYIMDTSIVYGINSTSKISNTNINSYINIITPHPPYETINIKLNMPLTKNINKILYSLTLGTNSYEILYDKLNADKRKSHAIYCNIIVWNFNLNNNNLVLNLNMQNNSINITSINLTNYNMTLTNAHKNLTIQSNLNIAMTNNTNYYNGVNEFTFNVNYARDAVRLNYTFNFLLANELNENKRLLLDIIYPNNTILFSFDFKFESIYNNAFKIYTNIFKPISLLIENNLSSKKDLSTHCEAKYSNNDLFINFEHRLSNSYDIDSKINITINNKTLSLDIFNKFTSNSNLDIRISMVTPLERLETGCFYFKINTTSFPNLPSSSPNYFGGVILSKRNIISLALYTSEEGTYWIDLHNDYLPVKLAYLYDISNLYDLKLFTYISWNQIQQFGLKFSLHNEFSDDRYLTVQLFVPYHTMELNMKVNRRNKLLYVFLVKVGELNYGFDILVQSDTKLNVYLNYNVIKLNLMNSFDKLNNNMYVKHGLLMNIVNNVHGTDKKVKLIVNNHYSDDMSKVTVEFDHWKLPHGIMIQSYDSATTSRLKFVYSENPNETFHAEFFSEGSESTQATKFLIQHPPSNLYYSFNCETSKLNLNSQVNLLYRNNRNILNNIGMSYTYDNDDKEMSIHGNKNSLNFGYDKASGWIQINEKNQMRLAYSSLSNVALFFGDLKYSFLSRLSARELLIQMGESINDNDFVDFLSLLKLNHSSLLYGKVVYSGKMLENLQHHYVHQYNDVNVATAHILDGYYDLTQTDLVSTMYAMYERVVISMDEIVNSTFDVLKQIAGDCVSQQDLMFKLSLPTWSSEQSSLIWDIYESLSTILKQYLHNVFQVFIIDVSRLFSFTDDVKNLIETSKQNIHSLYSHIDSLKTRIKQNTRLILTSTRMKLLELQSLTLQYLREAEEQIVLTVQSVAVTVQKKAITVMQYVYDVKDTVQAFVISVYDLATDFVSMFIEIDEVKFLMNYLYEVYKEYFNLETLRKFVAGLFQLVIEDLQKNFSDLTSYILSLCENKYIQSVRNFFAIVYYKSCWTWNYLHLTSRLENYFYSRVENSLYSLIFSSSHKSYSKYELSLDPPRVEFMQSIPRLISWEGFNTLPKVRGDTVLETWRRLDGAVLMTEIENFKYNLYEQFSSFGGLAVADKTFALLMGKQLVTFDGQLIEVPSEEQGTYILCYEIQDEKFVLLMEYDHKHAGTLHFWTGADRLSIRFGDQTSILLNGAPMELPHELSINAYLFQLDRTRVRISYEDHLSVLCQMESGTCVVEITPWLHGKVAGLLGNFDYEAFNDMAFPNATRSNKFHSFLTSWRLSDSRIHQDEKHISDRVDFNHEREVGEKADKVEDKMKPNPNVESSESSKQALTDLKEITGLPDIYNILDSNGAELNDLKGLKDISQMIESNGLQTLLTNIKSGPKGPNVGTKSGGEGPSFMSYDKVLQCESYFLRSRAPNLCFNLVSRELFNSLCLKSGDPCRAINAFIAMCRELDMEVQLFPPNYCVQCQIKNRTLHQGQSVTVHSTTSQRPLYDVVFLINAFDSFCMDEVNVTRFLYEMIHHNQSESTLPDLKFGFVVFNNNKYNSEIQMYTSEQKMWHTDANWGSRTFKRILEDKCPYFSCSDVTTTFEALKFVTKLTYRPGALRKIVLLQCSACSDKEGYSDTLAMLLESNLQIHILSPSYVLNKPGMVVTTASDIAGVDATEIYTSNGSRSLLSSPGNKHIIPKDLCTSLALSTQGSHFSLYSPVLPVWTRLIQGSSTQSMCQSCDCLAGDDGVGRLVCTRCGGGLNFVEEYDGELDGIVPIDYADDYMDPSETLEVLLTR